MKFLLIFLLSIQYTFAIDIIPIKHNDKAPKDGFFIDSDNMKELRKINEERKLYQAKNIKLEELSVVNEERITVYKELSSDYEKELSKEHSKGNLKGIGGFVLGVLATSLAAYAAIKVTK